MKDQDNIYRKIVQTVCECGNIINDSQALDNLRKNVFLDLFYRIKQNCVCLMKLSDIEEDYLAIRLLQRSIIEDLITVFFLFSLIDDDQRFTEALDVLDKPSKKSLMEWLKVHWEIDKTNANSRGDKYISEEKYLEPFNSYFQHSFKSSNNVQSNNSKSKSWSFDGKLSSMKSCTEGLELGKPIKYLYTEYRFLSQIEHYSPLNRGLSHSKDAFIKTHGDVIDFCVNYLLDLARSIINGTESDTTSITYTV